jgi:Zn-dependent protease
MAVETEASSPPPSPARLWAEQLAMGLALLTGILMFMALFHQKTLAAGMSIFGPNDMKAYGVASIVGVVLQIVMHELGSIGALWWLKIPVRLRIFGLGATAAASLGQVPRNIWTDARVGLAGPLTGTIVSAVLAGIYWYTRSQDASPAPVGEPFFLGMACVGAFYSLFTLVPILDLEGGWIAAAIAPQAWLAGLILTALELTSVFNLVLLGVVCFAVPRFFLLLRARAPRTDIGCTTPQRVMVALGYFALILALGWFSSWAFAAMPGLVRSEMGD